MFRPKKKNSVKIEDGEELIQDIKFNIYKFTDKTKPVDVNKIIIISSFSEFGCEVVSSMYCVPRIIQENPGYYYIVMGWYGRSYLYKHLVDEFWEIKEEFQWLRNYALAFHFDSYNLAKLEKLVRKFGRVIPSKKLGYVAVGNICNDCKNIWGGIKNVVDCPKCKSLNIVKSLFSDATYWKKQATRIPVPCQEKLDLAETYLKENSVGIIARKRRTYGRNLQPEFYVKLIKLLENRGYTPIWLGEKQNTLSCPVNHITDMTSKAQDLELTLAIVSKLKFTVQFWTASSRLSGIMGTPYLIIESPDQIFGDGQESYRLELCTMGNRKLALCHYLHMFNNNDKGLAVVEECIKEMEEGNWDIKMGLVEDVYS